MRNFTLYPISLVAVITAVALACDGSRVPTAPGQLGEEIVGGSSAASLVPFKGTFSAIGTAADVPGDRCPALTVHIEGTGTATHLGSLTTVQSHCVEPPSFAFTNGQFTFTAANGDQLFGTYQGRFPAAGAAGLHHRRGIHGHGRHGPLRGRDWRGAMPQALRT